MLGIDPGLRGAIAALQVSPAIHISVSSLPNLEQCVGGKVRRRVDLDATYSLLRAFAVGGPDLVVLEDVFGRPNQSGGVTFGKIGGALEAFLIALELRRHLVAPRTWTRAFKIPSKKTLPDASRLTASRLFPAFAHLWAKKTDHDKAEASLLAWYGATEILGYRPT